MAERRSTCLVPVWDDGIYRVRCSMGTKGVCAKHGPHRPHPSDGQACDPMDDGYCRTHGVYVDPYADSTPTEREARVRFPKSVGNATVDMETIQPTEREAGCDCGSFDGGHPGDCAIFRTEREAGDVGCTCANDGNASRCPLHTQADYDASAKAGDVGEVQPFVREALHRLRRHMPDRPRPEFCAACDQDADQLARALAPLIAERERAAKAEALREAARDWQVSLWPLGVVSWLRRRMTTHAHRTHDRHEPEGDLL